jgi:heme/copper-type cytochrome/quinol oxidase subunit 2
MPRTNPAIKMLNAVLCVLLAGLWVLAAATPRVIEITADRDNKFKVPGQKEAVITLKPDEVVVLRITARKATEWDKDGAVHSFTIVALKDKGWDLRLKEGTQNFTVMAPSEPGQYVVECTVKCGAGHEDMHMKMVVK